MLRKLAHGCIMLALFISSHAFALEGELFIYQDLLSKDNSVHAKVAAQSIHNKNIKNLQLADMVAQVYINSVEHGKTQTVDTKAWLLKALGASQSLRYKSLIDSVINSNADSKVKKYAKKALDNLSEPASSSYTDGDVSLTAIAQQVKKQKSTIKYSANKESFSQVYTGDSLAKVLKTIGFPNNIDVNFGTVRRWGVTASYSMLSLKYDELGSLAFHFQNGDIADWTVKKINNGGAFTGDLARHPLSSDSASMFRAHVRELISSTSATPLDFDLTAERLYSGLDDDQFIDALAWGCKLLATSGSAKYRAVLEHTMNNAGSRKLRKYAKKSLRQLPSGDAAQYKKGDVFKTQNKA